MPCRRVQLSVLGLQGAERGGGFIVAADGGAEALVKGLEGGGGGAGHGGEAEEIWGSLFAGSDIK